MKKFIESPENFIKRRKKNFKETLEKYKKTKENKYLRWFSDINRKGKFGLLREAWTFMVQYNLREKIFIVERFRRKKIIKPITHKLLKIDEVEYRIGYYIVGRIGIKKNKWTFGQFCPIIPYRDLLKLLAKAEKEKTIK